MTELSRRSLLGGAAAGVVVATVGLAPGAAAAVSPVGRAHLYTRGRFLRLHRKTFRLTDETGSWPMRLVTISDVPQRRIGAEHAFSMTFRSAAPGPPQGTYTLRRAGFSPTLLFVVPSDASRRTYQVVVNGG
jgi:hypothetical protein